MDIGIFAAMALTAWCMKGLTKVGIRINRTSVEYDSRIMLLVLEEQGWA